MIKIGDITEIRGQIQRGWIKLVEHPTGVDEKLSVIIASGTSDGPTLLITANVHGHETVGIVIIHRILEQLNLKLLRGRVVCIPSLNPTGLLRGTRHPQFDDVDPNRMWPSSKPKTELVSDATDYLDEINQRMDLPKPQERAWSRIFTQISEINPDFHIDLHTCSTLSIPYAFLDRVLYQTNKEEADNLFERTKAMVRASGLTIIADASASRYVKYNLYRSTSGSSLNKRRIPATTFELGPKFDVDPYCRDAAIKAINNIMKWAHMIDGNLEVITNVPVIQGKEIYRELNYPFSPCTGIVDYYMNPGDFFKINDLLAVVRQIDGTILEEIRSEVEGFVIAWWPGIAKYQGEPLGIVAVPDKLPFVVSWSDVNAK
ncbi:MAG: succinylglutamate desuccinylase/aspartoacylase family protein [Candidatus Heimdallarchaeota archaeon]|nr:succinylglutamate desuccinylase/aspartoacylase family protein [Candidatus Heimdallarchaeota archaeon]